MRSQLLALAMGAALFAWWSCGGPTDTSTSSDIDTVTVGNNYFDPFLDSVTTVGTSNTVAITFLWEIGGVAHNITWDTGPGTLPANDSSQTGGTYIATLGIGTYTYHDAFYSISDGMTGTIVVSKGP
jgi:plastocyanin